MSDEKPTVHVDVQSGGQANIPGPAKVDVAPGANINFMRGWFGVVMQGGAFAVVCMLFIFGYIQQEHRFDAAQEERWKADARAEARIDKMREEEAKTREKFYAILSELKLDMKLLLKFHNLLHMREKK